MTRISSCLAKKGRIKGFSIPYIPVNASYLWNVNSVIPFFFHFFLSFLHLICHRHLEQGLCHMCNPIASVCKILRDYVVCSAGLTCVSISHLTNRFGWPWNFLLDTDFGAPWGLEFLILCLTCEIFVKCVILVLPQVLIFFVLSNRNYHCHKEFRNGQPWKLGHKPDNTIVKKKRFNSWS